MNYKAKQMHKDITAISDAIYIPQLNASKMHTKEKLKNVLEEDSIQDQHVLKRAERAFFRYIFTYISADATLFCCHMGNFIYGCSYPKYEE